MRSFAIHFAASVVMADSTAHSQSIAGGGLNNISTETRTPPLSSVVATSTMINSFSSTWSTTSSVAPLLTVMPLPISGSYIKGHEVTIDWTGSVGMDFQELYLVGDSEAIHIPIVDRSECSIPVEANNCMVTAKPHHTLSPASPLIATPTARTSNHSSTSPSTSPVTVTPKVPSEPQHSPQPLRARLAWQSVTAIHVVYTFDSMTNRGGETVTSATGLAFSVFAMGSESAQITGAPFRFIEVANSAASSFTDDPRGSTSSFVTTSPTGDADASITSSDAPALAAAEAGHSGLSPGVTAGIAVAAIVFAAIGAGLIFWCVRRRRRMSHNGVGTPYGMSQRRSTGDLRAEKEMAVVKTQACAYEPLYPQAQHDFPAGSADALTSMAAIPPTGGTAPTYGAGRGLGHQQSDFVLYRDGSAEPETAATPAAIPIARNPMVPGRPLSQDLSPGEGAGFMSVADRARWDEEEARLDEAIAEAEMRGSNRLSVVRSP